MKYESRISGWSCYVYGLTSNISFSCKFMQRIKRRVWKLTCQRSWGSPQSFWWTPWSTQYIPCKSEILVFFCNKCTIKYNLISLPNSSNVYSFGDAHICVIFNRKLVHLQSRCQLQADNKCFKEKTVWLDSNRAVCHLFTQSACVCLWSPSLQLNLITLCIISGFFFQHRSWNISCVTRCVGNIKSW